MKKIKKTIFLIFALCSFIGAFSQTQPKTTIRGKVIDSKNKSSIIGANVVESNKENRVVSGTVTDVDGNFVYQMRNTENTLKISVIGYQPKVIKPNPLKSVVIELVSSDIELGGVTISANTKSDNKLTNIDERDNASSQVKIDLMDMKNSGITSAADALQGKVSGLDIVSGSGDPGSGSTIVIRGLSSMGNNKPLIVIDGIPQNKVKSDFDLSSANTEDISNMINIALQDIKSITVLKDAASTAIYGANGADGVLMIETYRGKMGKVQFSYTFKNTLNTQPPSIPMLNGDEYVTLQLDEWHNTYGVYNRPDEIAYNKDFVDFYNYSANTDWLGAITKNSITNDHYFNISGGGEKTRYMTSFSYVNEGGTTINTSSQRYSTRTNLDYNLSEKLLFTIQFTYSNNQTNSNYEVLMANGWERRNIRSMAYLKAPNMSIWQYDYRGNPTGEYFTRNTGSIDNYQGTGNDYFNPVAVANLGKRDENVNALENSFRLRYKINDWLVFKETVSFSYSGTKRNQFLPYNALGSDWLGSKVNYALEENSLWSGFKTESGLNFTIPFTNKDHVMSGAVSFVSDQSAYEWMKIETSRIPSTNIQDPAVGAQINEIKSEHGENRSVGIVGNFNYKYKDRYMLSINLRDDGSSSFGDNRRWGLFKGVSGAWRFGSEPFLKDWQSWLGAESKLRASWGTSGRTPDDPYKRFTTYVTKGSGSYITNSAIVPKTIQLDNLKWESIMSVDAGYEFNLFDDRLYIEGDFYKKITTDILFGLPWKGYEIPTSSGFSELGYLNGGELENKGWELMTSYKIIRKKDFLLSVDFNISQNQNTFTKLPDNFNTESSTGIQNEEYPKRVVTGQPIGSFFGFRYLGVWAKDEDVIATDAEGNKLYDGNNQPIPVSYNGSYLFKGGDAKYEDINHDGKIDLNDAVYLGNCNPTFMGGFGSSLRYKQFDFSFQFYYRLGFDIINMTAMKTQGLGSTNWENNGRNNQSKAVLNRWRTQGQNEAGLLPRASMDNPANNLGSDRYVEDGSFVRLNNIKLGYQLSQKLCQKFGLESANISLSGRKLFTVTNYSGQDPEVNQSAADPFWIGVDDARTPPSRMYTLSLSVGF